MSGIIINTPPNNNTGRSITIIQHKPVTKESNINYFVEDGKITKDTETVFNTSVESGEVQDYSTGLTPYGNHTLRELGFTESSKIVFNISKEQINNDTEITPVLKDKTGADLLLFGSSGFDANNSADISELDYQTKGWISGEYIQDLYASYSVSKELLDAEGLKLYIRVKGPSKEEIKLYNVGISKDGSYAGEPFELFVPA